MASKNTASLREDKSENSEENSTPNPIFNPIPCTDGIANSQEAESRAESTTYHPTNNDERNFAVSIDANQPRTDDQSRYVALGENLGKDVILVDRKVANSDPNKIEITILIVGNSNAGKSSFVHWFQERTFMESLKSTLGIEPSFTAARVRGQHYLVNLMDTAGTERFHSIPRSWYRNAHGAIVMYDITDYGSFKKVTDWKQLVEKNCKNDDIPYILVGNKVDLKEQSYIDGKRTAKDLEMAGYYETSAKTGEGVDVAMQSIIGLAVSTGRSTAVQHERRENVVKLQAGTRQKHKRKSKC